MEDYFMKWLRLRDMPLAIKLWIVIAAFVIPCLIIMSMVFNRVLVYTRDETVFSSIEKSQAILEQGQTQVQGSESQLIPQEYDAVMSVYHIGIVNRQVKYMTFPTSKFEGLSIKFIDVMGTSYSKQNALSHKYKITSNGYNLYYIIAKSDSNGVISFRVDTTNETVFNAAYLIIGLFTAGAAVISLLLALLFSHSIAKPLKNLERAAARTASGDFETPVALDRKDEIGRLSQVIDKARKELKRRDFLRQSAIQYVSHELKTPIMTISSYAQAINDKVYPKGSLEESVKVISSQADRLQGIVMKLLTLSRLDYLESKKQQLTKFDLAGVAEDVAARVCAARRDIEIKFEIEDVVINGLREECEVMAENLIENALRHAESFVKITVGEVNGRPFLSVFNDGVGIDEALLPQLFNSFTKGEKGVTGLGLSIVRRTAEKCSVQIIVQNHEGGVEFKAVF